MKVSIKSVTITPPVGMQMAGYSERIHGAIGVHDALLAQAIVIDDGLSKIAYVMCDVVGIDAFVTNQVRILVSSKTNIKANHIMIGAIHTHSSVYACRLNGQNFLPTEQFDQESDSAYYQQFIQSISGAIIWANDTLEEGRIGLGFGSVEGFGTNRNNIHAYYDKSVSVIKFERLDGSLLGLLVNHACHPTILNQDNYLFSADFIGYLRIHLKKMFPNSEIVYSQGAAGSASTRYTKHASTFEEADRLSLLLVGEVIKVLSSIETVGDIKVDAVSLPLKLKVKEFPSDAVCLAEIQRYTELLDQLTKSHAPDQEIRRAYVTLQGAQRNYIKKQNIQIDYLNTELQLLDFGICSIVGIPADCFGEIARDIKALAHSKPIITAGYTNDFLSYILSKEGYSMDCYEKNMTITTEDAHDIIVHVAKQLLKRKSD